MNRTSDSLAGIQADAKCKMQFAARFWILGAMLLALMAAITWISPALEKNVSVSPGTLYFFIGFYMVAGGIMLMALWAVQRQQKLSWRLLLGVGIAARFLLLFSTPTLENDYHRYLWDGALSANGHNPYRHSPKDVYEGNIPNESLVALANKGDTTIRQINHPHIRTIYPAVAQAVFALAHWIKPFDLTALRFVLLIFDIITLLLLVALLRHLKQPKEQLIGYWWNPLVMIELLNSAHMDVLMFPFILGALLLTLKQRWIAACVPIALAAGVKLWPIALLVLVFAHAWRHNKRLKTIVPAAICVAVMLALMALPVVLSGLDDSLGFFKYAQKWQNNAGLYRLIHLATKYGFGYIGIGQFASPTARLLGASLFVGLTFWVAVKIKHDQRSVVTAWLLVATGVYIFSPTQFPWYATWFIPLLVLSNNWIPLHLFAVTLPLYYLQYWMKSLGLGGWFDNGVVWIEHIPVWAGIVYWHYRTDNAPTRVLVKRN